MKKRYLWMVLCVVGSFYLTAQNPVRLYNKSLPEIKKLVNGKWQLVSGENETVYFEFDDTFIEFKNDTYVWQDEDGTESGDLNWRQQDTVGGEHVFLMDVFYDENPSYPFALKGDTLSIQDITENAFLYKLVKRK